MLRPFFNENDRELIRNTSPTRTHGLFEEQTSPSSIVPTLSWKKFITSVGGPSAEINKHLTAHHPSFGLAFLGGNIQLDRCAAGHHFHEGRWLRDTKYLDDDDEIWFGKGGNRAT